MGNKFYCQDVYFTLQAVSQSLEEPVESTNQKLMPNKNVPKEVQEVISLFFVTLRVIKGKYEQRQEMVWTQLNSNISSDGERKTTKDKREEDK